MTLIAVGGSLSTVGGTIAGLGGSFSPLDLNPSLWFDASEITGLADGDLVQTWSDQSGNAVDATQATSAARPVYKTAIVNGLPTVRFDGVDDGMETPPFPQTQTWTVFAVAKRITGTEIGHVVDSDSSISGVRIAQYIRYANATSIQSIAFNTAPSPFTAAQTVTPTDWNVLTGVRQSAVVTALVNGTPGADTATTGTPASGTEALMLGRFKNGGAYVNADLAEVIYYPTALSAADRADVHQYLGDKYGIAVA